MSTPNGDSNFFVNTAPPTDQGSLPLVVIDENEGSAIANDVRPSSSDVDTIIDYSKKLQDDLKALSEKIKLHEENIKARRTEKDELDDSILEKQVTLGKYYSSTPASTRNDSSSCTGGEEQILRHSKSAAAILCQLKKHPSSISPLASNRDILGVVATLGRVDDVNLSRLLSEYVGVETMLAIVCKAGAGVKALEDYSKDGAIDKNAGIHGFRTYMGRNLTGRFLVLCLENLRPYVGGFVAEDPQRRLQIPKPGLPNGECPPGFLGFAVNMIDVDATHLLCLTPCGYGLRETLFYHLFSRTQVYRTRAEMLRARPLISEGAISLDGGIIRSSGVDLLGNRQDVDVHFPSASAATESSANYQELQEKVTGLKSRREKVLEDLQKERQLLDHVKLNFEQTKQEFVKFMACSSSYSAQMHPGPRTHDVLYDQDCHRSERVWEEGYSSNNVITCRRVEASIKRSHEMDPRMDVYLRQAGFYGVARLPFIQLDWGLITALVERWRPETHTFHMRHGEMTVTLEDIAVQFGLPVDGNAVIGSSSLKWAELCHRLLGAVPECSAISYGRLKMKWLTERFNRLPNYATNEQVQQYTRAHILLLIGGMIFSDKSQNQVHLMYLPLLEDFEQAGRYSWGSACLAWLYRQLCRASNKDATQIAGPLILLQVWAWDRFPHISPRRRRHVLDEGMPLANRWGVNFDVKAVGTHVLSQYREAFDRQSLEQIIWRPYTDDILRQLPTYCLSGCGIWRARVPLICFYVVEWHHPDRVIRQFGGTQVIPEGCSTNKQKALHKIDLRGKHLDRWDHIHREYLDAWNSRMNSLAALEGEERFVYSHWYASNSRPTISHIGTMFSHLTSEMKKMQVTLEKGDPEEMWTVAQDVKRCRTLLEEHTAVRLHGRTNEQYRPQKDEEQDTQDDQEHTTYVQEMALEDGDIQSLGR